MKCNMTYNAIANLVAAVDHLKDANKLIALAGRDVNMLAASAPSELNKGVADSLNEMNDSVIRTRQTIQKILEEL